MITREQTKRIYAGFLSIGGSKTVSIQSMTTTKTKDIESTIKQINDLENAGCELVRVAILDHEDADAIKEIKKGIKIPLAADIHYDPELALRSIANGVDKIRLNPGNIQDNKAIAKIVAACKDKKIPIRIGVNAGSLPKDLTMTAENMIVAAKRHIDILEQLDFYDIVLSLKASNVPLMIEAYRLAAKTFPYPLHLGVTEAGTLLSGSIKSALGIGILLHEGIGSTIRVSLTDDPVSEIYMAKEILNTLQLRRDMPTLVSCPTCGRLQYDMINIANAIDDYLKTLKVPITVAVMGCAVNGPGEAKHADIGIAGGKDEVLLFRRGKIIRKIPQENAVAILKQEIANIVDEIKST